MHQKLTTKIQSFTDLYAWKEGHKLVVFIYKTVKTFPSFEQHGLGNQMRRAAVSITSNIAEGFSRRTSKEKQQFYRTALASLTEIQNQLLIAKDVEYIHKDTFNSAADQSVLVNKLIHGLLLKHAPSR